MNRFPAKAPWTVLYERSGLKSVSERVRRQPLVRRAERSLEDLRRTVLDAARQRSPEAAAAATWAVRQMLGESQSEAQSVINATDVLAPRSLSVPLADAAIAAMAQAASQSFEHKGTRAAVAAVCQLVGSEAAIIFTSPSMALLATVSALATGRELLAARHQVGTIYDLVLPDAIDACGARLGEVGAVDQLSEAEVARRLQSPVAAIWMHLAGVGFHVSGKTEFVDEAVPIDVARQSGKPTLAVCDLARFPCAAEFPSNLPAMEQFVARYDLVIAPGDRFLGGPGCGVLAGRREWIDRVAEHPLARAALADFTQLAGLVRTIELLRQPETAVSVPLVQLIAATPENLQERASRIVSQIETHSAFESVTIQEQHCLLAEGRPESLPGCCIAITPRNGAPQVAVNQLRCGPMSVWCTADTQANHIQLNLRSVLPRQDEALVSALLRVS